jgi:hypothetical protein
VPVAADLVFDVRNLPNPHYERDLRPLTGRDPQVVAFLTAVPAVAEMIDDIAGFIGKWLPSYVADNRHYLTVAIGCTGGRHRSVHIVEELARASRGANSRWCAIARSSPQTPADANCAVSAVDRAVPGGCPAAACSKRVTWTWCVTACARDAVRRLPDHRCARLEVGPPPKTAEIGCLARITAWDMKQLACCRYARSAANDSGCSTARPRPTGC